MDEAYELYRRTRNEKVDRTSKIEAWFEEQKELNAKASLPGKSSIHGGLSDTGSRRSENADRDLGDGIKSENEGEMESEEFDDDSGDSLVDMDREDIDTRFRPYHRNPILCEPTVSREEFDRYRVLAEEQMKQLRQQRDQLMKMYSGKCDDLRKEMEKREAPEIPEVSERETIGIKAKDEQEHLPIESTSQNGKTTTTRSEDGPEEVDVFADSPFESVRQATRVCFQARELRILLLFQGAAAFAKAKRWNGVEERAIEALELVGKLKNPAIEAKCWVWYGIALYHRGRIDKAAEMFAQSKTYGSHEGPDWIYTLRPEGGDMDPDKWLKRCERVKARVGTEDLPMSRGERKRDVPIDNSREIDPNTPWYSLPRCSVGVGNWVKGVENTDPNNPIDESESEEEGSEKWEDAQEEWEESERPGQKDDKETALEKELAGCAILEDPKNDKELGEREDTKEQLGGSKDTQGED